MQKIIDFRGCPLRHSRVLHGNPGAGGVDSRPRVGMTTYSPSTSVSTRMGLSTIILVACLSVTPSVSR